MIRAPRFIKTRHQYDEHAYVVRYCYTPYGQRIVMNASFSGLGGTSSYGQQRGFQGLLHDEESGLIENRARMLDPLTGRFVQRDPLGYPDGMNSYAAYHVMWSTTDPSGKAGGWGGAGTTVTDENGNNVDINPFSGKPLSPKTARQWEIDQAYRDSRTGFTVIARDVRVEGFWDVTFARIAGGHTDIYFEGKKLRHGAKIVEVGHDIGPITKAELHDVLKVYKLKKRKNGTLKYGPKSGACCEDVTNDEIIDCVREAPMDGTYHWLRNNCQHDVERVVKYCCLRGYSASLPATIMEKPLRTESISDLYTDDDTMFVP